MFYAKLITDKYQEPTVGAYDNRPLNFEVHAYETKAARQAAIDAKWEAGGNGFKCTRPAVVAYFGWNFSVVDGTCGYAGAEEDMDRMSSPPQDLSN